jgi:succinyl-CoA synthetase alpha subunit
MAIIATERTRVVVQGLTGSEAQFRALRMMEYGTKILAGVTPGKGRVEVHGIPVYDTMEEALKAHPEINASVVMVGAAYALDPVLEAIDAAIENIIVLAEGIPVHDAMIIRETSKRMGVRVVGPNCPGVISPGICELGATAHCAFHGPGKVGVVSVTGSGQWYISRLISLSGIGISTYLGIGGDPVKCTSIPEAMLLFEKDPTTEAMMLVSEIGGTAEMELAKMAQDRIIRKPIVAYIYGRTAPSGKRMGHAGAIIQSGKDDVRTKMEVLRDAGVRVILYPWEVVGAFLDAGIEPLEELNHKPWREAKTGR